MSGQVADQAQVAEDDMGESFGPLLINKLEVCSHIHLNPKAERLTFCMSCRNTESQAQTARS